jgi:hypothetical protein
MRQIVGIENGQISYHREEFFKKDNAKTLKLRNKRK